MVQDEMNFCYLNPTVHHFIKFHVSELHFIPLFLVFFLLRFFSLLLFFTLRTLIFFLLKFSVDFHIEEKNISFTFLFTCEILLRDFKIIGCGVWNWALKLLFVLCFCRLPFDLLGRFFQTLVSGPIFYSFFNLENFEFKSYDSQTFLRDSAVLKL